MIIANSSIGMDSARNYTSVSSESKHLQIGIVTSFNQLIENKADKAAVKNSSSKSGADEESPGLSNARQSFDNIFERMRAFATSSSYEEKLERDAMTRIRTECLQFLMFILFGRKPDDDSLLDFPGNSADAPASEAAGQNIFYEQTESYTSFYAEQEETSFTTQGTVVTADGRELSFNLDLSMSRSFTSYYEESVSTLRSFTDPLVINLDSDCAFVSDVKISFDLDADGQDEEISRLSSGSGYLALDNNGDGIINDGSELFGTRSGDGFADLSEYDSDHNGWIDEADEVFTKLKICIMNEDGSQTLYSLKDKDIGAICLKSESTDFSLNNLTTNETNARIRRTGIFLYENGGLGTMQHLDLAQ